MCLRVFTCTVVLKTLICCSQKTMINRVNNGRRVKTNSICKFKSAFINFQLLYQENLIVFVYYFQLVTAAEPHLE